MAEKCATKKREIVEKVYKKLVDEDERRFLEQDLRYTDPKWWGTWNDDSIHHSVWKEIDACKAMDKICQSIRDAHKNPKRKATPAGGSNSNEGIAQRNAKRKATAQPNAATAQPNTATAQPNAAPAQPDNIPLPIITPRKRCPTRRYPTSDYHT
jgi:hypothetical protein